MGRLDTSSFVARFKRVMSESVVNELGRAMRFCQRERLVSPHRLAVSLLSLFATTRMETLADMQRGFNALFGATMAYKPFHNQLAKQQFAVFMRTLVRQMLEHWVMRVLQVRPGGAFAEFEHIVIQDGSSFAVAVERPVLERPVRLRLGLPEESRDGAFEVAGPTRRARCTPRA